MEGKAVLFKEFANIDVFDIEIDEQDPQKFIETVARLEPSFGGINLEDIRAPECFIIEKGLNERMNIPVFHDDQHGTAIVVAAAIYNGLRVVGKKIDEMPDLPSEPKFPEAVKTRVPTAANAARSASPRGSTLS